MCKILLALALFIWLSPTFAWSGDQVYAFVLKKQDEKRKNRWSLSEWLETRDRMRLQDLWLAMNSSSPFEFYIAGDHRWVDSSVEGQTRGIRLQGGAFAQIFGIELQKSFVPYSEFLGTFSLRLLGFHAQGTNLTAHLGIRTADTPVALHHPTVGASATLYFTKYFGAEGMFRHAFASSSGAITSNRYEAGAFIDFNFLRIYGDTFVELERRSSSVVNRSGSFLGTKIFF